VRQRAGRTKELGRLMVATIAVGETWVRVWW